MALEWRGDSASGGAAIVLRRIVSVTAMLVAAQVVFESSLAIAQTSASFKLEESTFNAGGRPAAGTIATSASFRVTADAIGDAAVARGMSSASFRSDASFLVAYAPPGEVDGFQIAADKQTLSWSPEPSVGVYNLHRDLLSNLSGLAHGNCEQQDVADEMTTDPAVPPVSDGYFYFVTAENRLGEEGTKGHRSNGLERAGTACP